MEELWYKNVAYEDAKELVRENLVNTVTAFIASGYWLKQIRDSGEYEKEGYLTFWECAEAEFGLKISEASRAMSMNDKYSLDGNSPCMSESYKQYNKSQLQEMLTMSDEQIEQVTPDMTVKEIREIKNPVKEQQESVATSQESVITEPSEESEGEIVTEIEIVQEQEEELNIEFDTNELLQELDQDNVIDGEYREVKEEVSAYGLPKTEYPEGSLLTTEGCGHKYTCFSCARVCDIRQKERYCVDAPLGNPYRCATMDILKDMNQEVFKEDCQFFNLEIADHTAGSDEPVPCCKKCKINTTCLFCCDTAKEYLEHMTEKGTDKVTEETVQKEPVTQGSISRLGDIKCLLRRRQEELSEYLACDGIPETTIFEKKTIVGALANMVCELENVEEKEIEEMQKELPVFKNNNDRKAWLEDVEAWGLWYEDHNIQARYYKYDFPDGSRLIAVKYRYTCPPWLKDTKDYADMDGGYKNTYYHMIYSDEYKKTHQNDGYENYYGQHTVSVGILVEFIKEMSKRETK